MSKYDLTPTLCKYFDKHMVLSLLEFVEYHHLYAPKDIQEYKLKLLRETKMCDLYAEVYEQLYTKAPSGEETRRKEVEVKWQQMEKTVKPIVGIIESEEVAKKLQEARDRESNQQVLQYLIKEHDFHESMLDTLYECAKFQFECGSYEFASPYLQMFRTLVPASHRHYLDAMWGKTACEILLQKWDEAREDFNKLKMFIENHQFSTELELLQQRAWLIHWSLWVSILPSTGDYNTRDDFITLCFENNGYMNAMEVVCPHILRYLTVAVVTSRKRKNYLKELVKIIKIEEYNYSDPITELLMCLHVRYDFDGAQEKLRECREVISKDFFLSHCADDFIEHARQLIFEMFCRIHQKISIKMLAEKLNMDEDHAERWLVNLIRNAQMDAKIDASKGHVVMGAKASSLHEQVMENTKRLSLRAQQMSITLEKVQKEKMGSSAYMPHS